MVPARPMVSAVVITYNEERNIRECLQSIQWVDELVVVDSGSDDRTVPIACEFGARVVTNPWPGRFSVQRNVGLAQVTGEWILILDADERVTPEGRHEIEGWLASEDARAYVVAQVPRRNFFFGRWLRFGGAYPDPQWRLLRRGKVVYDERTADTAMIAGACKRLSEPIDHLTGASVHSRVSKAYRDADYRARELASQGRSSRWPDLAIRPAAAFFKTYVTKRGFRDGVEGLIYAMLVSFETYLRYVRLWELGRGNTA